MAPYREARAVMRAALAGDRNACGLIQITFRMAMGPGPHQGRANLMAHLLKEALDDEQAVRDDGGKGVEIEVREVEVKTAGCKIEHPADIPCEDCAATFVRPAKKVREARV